MKRLILLALVLTPLALLSVDRLMCPGYCGGDARTADLAFSFPEPPRPPLPPPLPTPPAPPTIPAVATDAPPADEAVRNVQSALMANEDRALASLREQIEVAVSDWLADAGIPRTWKAPRSLIDPMIQGRPEVFLAAQRDYGDLYQAEVPVAFRRDQKARFVETFRQEVATRRLGQLGGVLTFILACLAILAGYIRTDEATRGYYTTRLRLLAAAGLGAAGVVLYRFLGA